jgi:hypothetical protein
VGAIDAVAVDIEREPLDSALSITVRFLNPVEERATQGEGGAVMGRAAAS